MQTIVLQDSPLASYLEGKGEAESEYIRQTTHNPPSPSLQSFAPTGRPTPLSISSQRRPRRTWTISPANKIRNVYASLVTSTLGSDDNERFLEHFRYIIIASQLLNEHIGACAFNPPAGLKVTHHLSSPSSKANVCGALLTAVAAFFLAWLLDWTYGGGLGQFNQTRAAIVLVIVGLLAIALYAYARRQWLQYLRRQAIESVSRFAATVQLFEAASSSIFTLIQEVELVSRGYRISSPLPPITRLEGKDQNRRCSRLRRSLQTCFAVAIPTFAQAGHMLQPLLNEDDLQKFFEVYDIRHDDLQETSLGYGRVDADDNETIKQLRVHQYHFSTLRRMVLCSLLSLPATGRNADAVRWKTAVKEMERLSILMDQSAQDLNKLLDEEEQVPQPTTVRASSPNTQNRVASHTRLQSQIRRISTLSTGIRALQAKLYLLRDDSTRALPTSTSEPDLFSLSASLRDQYDAIGADLKVLMQAWETGRAALNLDINKQELRISRPSSVSGALQSPRSSVVGLPIVDEDTNGLGAGMGSPLSALRALNGETVALPLSPPSTDNGEDTSVAEDEEVFEAIAVPRQRSVLSREQRIAKMVERREEMAVVKEKKMAGVNMMRELESVISLRPPTRRTAGGRITTM